MARSSSACPRRRTQAASARSKAWLRVIEPASRSTSRSNVRSTVTDTFVFDAGIVGLTIRPYVRSQSGLTRTLWHPPHRRHEAHGEKGRLRVLQREGADTSATTATQSATRTLRRLAANRRR